MFSILNNFMSVLGIVCKAQEKRRRAGHVSHTHSSIFILNDARYMDKLRLSGPLRKEKLRSPPLGAAHPPRSPRSGR